jgi:transposase
VVNILTGSEAYTSKQCGQCGHLNDGLGGKEIFQCGQCGVEVDRDVHTARNILLRFFGVEKRYRTSLSILTAGRFCYPYLKLLKLQHLSLR